MADKTPPEKPKQKTPKGYEIPVPKRKDFDKLVKKAAQPSTPRRSGK
jgi:hypothetical protein